MANFNPNTGKWESAGGGSHDTRHDAQMHENMKAGGGNGFAEGILSALWKFFCLIPKLLGLAVGAMCGIFLKFGIIGKAILSALAAAGALIILAVVGSEIHLTNSDSVVLSTVSGIIICILAVAVGVWFWIWHYKVLKNMPYSHFVALTTQCMMICFWGPITISLFFVLLKLFNSIDKSPIGFAGSIGISLAVAIGYWLIKVNAYKTPESDTDTNPNTNPNTDAGSDSNYSPTPRPADDSRCSPGDLVWARWSQDGNLYFAGIAHSSDTSAKVVSYDGVEEEVPLEDIFYLSEAQKSGLTPCGNWENKGSFYPCQILKLGENSALVKYIEDNVKEDLPYHGLVFMN